MTSYCQGMTGGHGVANCTSSSSSTMKGYTIYSDMVCVAGSGSVRASTTPSFTPW